MPRLAAYRTAGQPGEFHGTPGAYNETYLDSRGQTQSVGDCSAHWFTVKGSIVALGNYEQGTRFLDISDPTNPRLTGRLWLGGLLGKPSDAGRDLHGGPQMIQLSLDGRRLYVTNSLYSTWDNQFYPELRSWLLRVNCDPDGGMQVDRDFFVDFHDRPAGPARAHEVRLQGGDCTTEIFQ